MIAGKTMTNFVRQPLLHFVVIIPYPRSPDGGADEQIRMQVNFMFPTKPKK